ncbi:hypothetical protein NL676_031105 [Syzygium grande]|nr:hypothetical protein NL676_031105 [Syzygium grande]
MLPQTLASPSPQASQRPPSHALAAPPSANFFDGKDPKRWIVLALSDSNLLSIRILHMFASFIASLTSGPRRVDFAHTLFDHDDVIFQMKQACFGKTSVSVFSEDQYTKLSPRRQTTNTHASFALAFALMPMAAAPPHPPLL